MAINPSCSVGGDKCSKPGGPITRGMCLAHYRQWGANSKPPCSEEGCEKRSVTSGLCRHHYELVRRLKLGPCSVDGCEKLGVNAGMCSGHYQMDAKYGDPLHRVRVDYRGVTCCVAGCGKQAKARGYCQMHYKRFLKWGESLEAPPKPPSPPKICSVGGCSTQVRCKGLCERHYQRAKKYDGDPLGQPAPRAKKVRPRCSAEGCTSDATSGGGVFCRYHYDLASVFGPGVTIADASASRRKAKFGEATAFLLAAAEYDGDDCLLWPFSINSSGYGQVNWERKPTRAHRMVLILAKGEPPSPGLVACHAPGICHTRLCVNPNHLRWDTQKANKADTLVDGTKNHGERCGTAILTEADVHVIRHVDRRDDYEVALDYGVSKGAIYCVRNYINWRHLP